MAKIEQMILKVLDNRASIKTAIAADRLAGINTFRYVDACLAACRAHALIDAYEAVGGDGKRWRNEAKLLR